MSLHEHFIRKYEIISCFPTRCTHGGNLEGDSGSGSKLEGDSGSKLEDTLLSDTRCDCMNTSCFPTRCHLWGVNLKVTGSKLEGDSGSKLEGALLLGTRCHNLVSLTIGSGSKLLLLSMCNYVH